MGITTETLTRHFDLLENLIRNIEKGLLFYLIFITFSKRFASIKKSDRDNFSTRQ